MNIIYQKQAVSQKQAHKELALTKWQLEASATIEPYYSFLAVGR